jgi:hypothetical protein
MEESSAVIARAAFGAQIAQARRMRSTLFAAFAPLLAVSLFAACGGATQGSTPAPQPDGGATTAEGGATMPDAAAPADAAIDVDNGTPSSTYPAPHPAMPQVVSNGGPTLAMPRVVPIFFPSYPYKDQIVDYVSKVGATPYWSAAVTEYGVGALTAGTAIQLTEAAPSTISDSDIQNWLVGKLDGTNADFGMPDASTIYTIYYPTSTTIDLQGSTSCVDFGGYHNNVDMNGKSIPYAVIPQCAKFHALMDLDVITGTSSHEWVEAVSDPYPNTNPGFTGLDDDHAAWEFALGGGEIGDMCSPFDTSFYKPMGFDYIVQRTWSNAAAMAGHDPCVPGIPSQPYFNSAAVLTDSITLNFGGGFTTKGVKIPVGQSKTIEIDLFSEAATSGPWTVAVREPSRAMPPPAPTLDLALDRTSGVNGEKLHLTIKVLKASTYKAETFEIVSTLGAQKAYWVGMVGN